jgi:hypothetical protein
VQTYRWGWSRDSGRPGTPDAARAKAVSCLRAIALRRAPLATALQSGLLCHWSRRKKKAGTDPIMQDFSPGFSRAQAG